MYVLRQKQPSSFNLFITSTNFFFRLSATLKCNFDLRKFPLDHQHCLVEMESCKLLLDSFFPLFV